MRKKSATKMPLPIFKSRFSEKKVSEVTVASLTAFPQNVKISVAESKPEPVELKLLEIWSRGRNYVFNKYLLLSV